MISIKDIKDKYLFTSKINAIESICRGYLGVELDKFSFIDSLYCCSMDKNNTYRKPNTGMLEQLYYQYRVESEDECIMIGDASGKLGDRVMIANGKVGTIVSLYTKSYEHIRYCNYIPMVRVKLDENTGLEYFAVVNNIKKI